MYHFEFIEIIEKSGLYKGLKCKSKFGYMTKAVLITYIERGLTQIKLETIQEEINKILGKNVKVINKTRTKEELITIKNIIENKYIKINNLIEKYQQREEPKEEEPKEEITKQLIEDGKDKKIICSSNSINLIDLFSKMQGELLKRPAFDYKYHAEFSDNKQFIFSVKADQFDLFDKLFDLVKINFLKNENKINLFETNENLYHKLQFINANKNLVVHTTEYADSITMIEENQEFYFDLNKDEFNNLVKAINYLYNLKKQFKSTKLYELVGLIDNQEESQKENHCKNCENRYQVLTKCKDCEHMAEAIEYISNGRIRRKEQIKKYIEKKNKPLTLEEKARNIVEAHTELMKNAKDNEEKDKILKSQTEAFKALYGV